MIPKTDPRLIYRLWQSLQCYCGGHSHSLRPHRLLEYYQSTYFVPTKFQRGTGTLDLRCFNREGEFKDLRAHFIIALKRLTGHQISLEATITLCAKVRMPFKWHNNAASQVVSTSWPRAPESRLQRSKSPARHPRRRPRASAINNPSSSDDTLDSHTWFICMSARRMRTPNFLDVFSFMGGLIGCSAHGVIKLAQLFVNFAGF